MSEIKNSALLDKLIKHAETVGDKKSTVFTAERFLVAVCDYIEGMVDARDVDGIKALRIKLISFGLRPRDVRAALIGHINSVTSGSDNEKLYIQKKMLEARA